jgi:hypothetical protein
MGLSPTRGERTRVKEALAKPVWWLTTRRSIRPPTLIRRPHAHHRWIPPRTGCQLVVTDHGGLTATMEIPQSGGKGADDVYGIGFDLSPLPWKRSRAATPTW